MDTEIKVLKTDEDEFARVSVSESQIPLNLNLPPETPLEGELRRIGFNSLTRGLAAWRLVEEYPPRLDKKERIFNTLRNLEYILAHDGPFDDLVLRRERERIRELKLLLSKYNFSLKFHAQFIGISRKSKEELRNLVAQHRLRGARESNHIENLPPFGEYNPEIQP